MPLVYDRSDYVPANPLMVPDNPNHLANEAYYGTMRRRQRQRRRSNEGPEQRLVCPCKKCARPSRDEPTSRLLSVVQRHIEKYEISHRWKYLYDQDLARYVGVELSYRHVACESAPNIVRSPDTPLPNPNIPTEQVPTSEVQSDWNIHSDQVPASDVQSDHAIMEPEDYSAYAEMIQNLKSSGNLVELTEMQREAFQPLYDEAHTTRMHNIVNLLHIASTFKIPNVAMTEIFRSINRDIIPKNRNSKMPETYEEGRQLIKQLGLDYQVIHACPCDNFLYFGEQESTLKYCPKCNTSRYKMNTVTGQKKAYYFPLIPRLLQIFKSPNLAGLMTWWHQNRSNDSIMRIPADSEAWKSLEEEYPELVRDPRLAWLAISMDGVNPFGKNSGGHSTWPIVVAIYNLPPWLTIRKEHLILNTIVPGPKKVKNMNTYLRPLVEELKTLFLVGVPAYDISATIRPKHFQLHALVLWTITDYPGYSEASSLQTAGHFACPPCGPDQLESYSAKHLHKIIYVGYRKFLKPNDPIRGPRYKNLYNKKVDFRPRPKKITQQFWLDQWERKEAKLVPLDKSGMRGKSIFFELPYYKNLKIPHLLDVMHIEKNISTCLFRTFSNTEGTKADSLAVRAELKKMNSRDSLWPQDAGYDENGNKKWICARAPWTWTPEEYNVVVQIMSSIKAPTGYGSSFSTKFSVDSKLVGMKTHDHHNLLQDILPILVRGTLTEEIRDIVYRLSSLFRWLSAKEICEAEIHLKVEEAYSIMAKMEAHFPPTVFDIQFHLIVHLVPEVALAGPVSVRWMYFIERFLGVLKSFVRQRARPEGSMAEGYLMAESMHYLIEYSSRLDCSSLLYHRLQEDPKVTGVVLPKILRKPRKMERTFYEQAHRFVLRNHPAMAIWRSRYEEAKRANPSIPIFRFWIADAVHNALCCGHEGISCTIEDLASGPDERAEFWTHCWAFGSHYRIMSHETGQKVTFDCGVSAIFDEGGVETPYYGYLDGIVTLNYCSFKITLFHAKWFWSITRGVRQNLYLDECGHNRIKRGAFISDTRITDEPFVFPSEVEQVFYIDDRINRGWQLIVHSGSRSRRVVYHRENEVEERSYDDDAEIAQQNNFPATSSAILTRSQQMANRFGESTSHDEFEESNKRCPGGNIRRGRNISARNHESPRDIASTSTAVGRADDSDQDESSESDPTGGSLHPAPEINGAPHIIIGPEHIRDLASDDENAGDVPPEFLAPDR